LTNDQVSFDLTDINDEGFATIPPGRYQVEADEWVYYVKEETLNPVIRMRAKILSGDYEGETVAYFSTMTKARISKQNYMRALRAFGLIKSEDRGPKGELATSLALGEPNDRGESPVKAIVVNGETRSVKGKAIAIVTPQSNDKSKTSVDRFEAIPQHSSPASGFTIAEDDVPF
jgi:hypothetical protein